MSWSVGCRWRSNSPGSERSPWWARVISCGSTAVTISCTVLYAGVGQPCARATWVTRRVIVATDSAGAVEFHLGVEEEFRPARKAHPGIVVTDLDGLVEWLARANQPLRWDTDFPGFRRIYAHDPFGNRLEFLQRSYSAGFWGWW